MYLENKLKRDEMKNYEKYADEIKNFDCNNDFCDGFVKPYILKSSTCVGTSCVACQLKQAVWLLEEYEEPEVDWNNIAVDTPILVRESKDREWKRRYFAKYKDGIIFAWVGGNTSWTALEDTTKWKYAKLAESEEN